jgi:glucose/arabinose dehydrogenase/PKD repeat protein
LTRDKPRSLAILVVLTAALLLPVTAARAGTPPPGFNESVAFSGLTEPTSIAFSPDGRVFVAQKSGVIKVFDSLADTTPETFADLSKEVYNFWDRGLLGLALDPEFPAKPYVYVLYTLDAVPGGSVPRWGGKSAGDPCPSPPGPTADGCVVTGRLSKLTASGNSMSVETPLITDWCQQFPSHSIGDLAFGADGVLYVSGGEGASYNAADWGQYGTPVNPCDDPPGGVGAALTPPTAEGGSLRSQDVRTPGDPTGLDGTLLRIDPETGEGLPGNPYADSLDANARRIAAFGFRNPFRIAIEPASGDVWVGDVGQGTWEEIDRVDPDGSGPKNFGWPCYEGNKTSSARLNSWDNIDINLCESLYSEGLSAVAAPTSAYKHGNPVLPGETCPTGGASISGLTFYEAGPFPNEYSGALFFADYSRNCIWVMMPGADGRPNPADVRSFDPGAHAPVNLKVGPDGALYFADLSGGKIWKITHTTGNQPPTAVATATPEDGTAPLQVQLSAAGSSDPDPGDELSYSWDLNGDGEFGDSTEISPSYVYEQPGTHTATVRISDPDGSTDSDAVSIQVDNAPPTATIEAPSPALTWAVGDPIAFSASATDPQDGTLPASAYKWSVIVHHCPSDCHLHTVETFVGQTEGVFVGPDHEYPSWLEFRLTVTDSGKLTDTESVRVDPQTVTVNIQSFPASGFEVSVDSTSGETPFSKTVIKGSNNTISAPPQTVGETAYTFGAWSDDKAATHNVIANQDVDMTAVFGPPAAPAITATSPSPGGANDNSPKVTGTVGSDFPTSVKLFASPDCSGSPAAIGEPEQFTGAGIAINVPDDAVTQISAATANAAGDSNCSAPISYTEDSTGPAPPDITATSPPSPAHDANPEVKGALGDGDAIQVEVYPGPDCTGNPSSGSSAAFTGSGITLAVPGNQTSQLSARALDAVGNPSACSGSFGYVEDSTLPVAPQIDSISPLSPANDNNPEIAGSSEAGTTVDVYAGGDCSGPALATASAALFETGMTLTLVDDTDTTLSAAAIDNAENASPCSNSIEYVEDSTPPAVPVIAPFSLSPANANQPRFGGNAEASSTVSLYANADCSGPAVNVGTPAEFAAGFSLTVADDSDTSVSANAVDAAGNLSPCSAPIEYVEDSMPPAKPLIGSPSPVSPANANTPMLHGIAESGSTVRLYPAADCSGPAVASLPTAQFAIGVSLTVADDSSTTFAATATDAAGNTSACSPTSAYVEDSTAPQTSISRAPRAHLDAPRKRVRGRVGVVRAGFSFKSDDGSAHFVCKIDSAAPAPCSSPVTRVKFTQGTHRFAVRAIDAVGNFDATPAARKVTVREVPILPPGR